MIKEIYYYYCYLKSAFNVTGDKLTKLWSSTAILAGACGDRSQEHVSISEANVVDL